MTKRAAALLAVVVLATACGGTDEPVTSAHAVCKGIPPPTARTASAAVPRPVSPEGAVASWAAEYWHPDETLAEGGLCVVSETDAGTFALTGVVLNARGPVSQARLTVEAVSPPATTLHAVTDEHGAFAFVNVPVRGDRTCYRTTVTAFGRQSWTDVEWMEPGEYAQSIELDLPLGPAQRFCTEQR